jgi:phospholipid/cholesterol/gamma-HCH transport system permease protein
VSIGVPSKRGPRVRRVLRRLISGWNRVGGQAQFYFTTLGSVADAAVRYRVETLRLIAQMSLGTGALAVIGGTIAIVGFLNITTGALPGILGYNQVW